MTRTSHDVISFDFQAPPYLEEMRLPQVKNVTLGVQCIGRPWISNPVARPISPPLHKPFRLPGPHPMAKALELTLRDLAPADATGQRALDVHRLPWARGYKKRGAAHPGGGMLDPQQVGLAANPGSTTASVDE